MLTESETMISISTSLLKAHGFELSSEEKTWLTMCASRWPNAWSETTVAIYTARMSERSLNNHAEALKEATKASEKYTKRLVWATWALAIVTAVLVYATFSLNNP